MTKRVSKKSTKIIIEQMPGESQQQFVTFLVYCAMLKRSARGLWQNWAKLGKELAEQEIANQMGIRPSHSTLDNWAKKFYWKERAIKWDLEKKEIYALEFQKVISQRPVRVARLFEKVSSVILPQITASRLISVDDFKKSWEMLRTESGESIGKQEFDLNQDSELSDEAKVVLDLWRKQYDPK